ncbi:MAG TPA: amidohydrolase [Bryobacteraceae bacterium]|nr:amidohydrolase [Bryobacteraceae bacterium]
MAVSAGAAAQERADTIYYNGQIVTMSSNHPTAQAVAIQGDRFLAVGSNADVLKTAGPRTKKINLAGQSVVPGLIESHVHPLAAALSEIEGTIPVFKSIPEIQTYIKSQAAKLPKDRLIFIPKVYSTRLIEHRYPTRQELDTAAPEREVVVDNGYASVLNSKVMKRLGITSATPQPSAGRIVIDKNGEPTGLVLGASQLLSSVRGTRKSTAEERVSSLESMLRTYSSVGITSIIDRGETAQGFRAYQTLHDAGRMKVRAYVTYLVDAKGSAADLRQEIERIPFVTGSGDKWFTVGSLKTVIDGGILIGTAYLREPYGRQTGIYGFVEDGYRGVLSVPRENVFEMAKIANELGWQMTAHTTGGGATDLLLDAYEAANAIRPIQGRRFTVTHGNFPNAAAIQRARKLGVAFDVQPAWMYLDGPAIKDVFGPERMKDFQPFRSMIDGGVVIAGGSDHMIRFDPRLATNPFHPFFGMWMAITRQMVDGKVLNPEQRISRAEALKMWTWNGAYLAFSEKEKGSIEPGKLADMVVISKNYMTCPENDIKNIEPLKTIVGGQVVFDASAAK